MSFQDSREGSNRSENLKIQSHPSRTSELPHQKENLAAESMNISSSPFLQKHGQTTLRQSPNLASYLSHQSPQQTVLESYHATRQSFSPSTYFEWPQYTHKYGAAVPRSTQEIHWQRSQRENRHHSLSQEALELITVNVIDSALAKSIPSDLTPRDPLTDITPNGFLQPPVLSDKRPFTAHCTPVDAHCTPRTRPALPKSKSSPTLLQRQAQLSSLSKAVSGLQNLSKDSAPGYTGFPSHSVAPHMSPTHFLRLRYPSSLAPNTVSCSMLEA
jgi:hypothetical protein